ncbi:MAG TPA: hypothetical protein DDW52_30500 [Planctomycetaceae bacterium]|nr:hypothetical protein [Planctomycetaceae bacterium]
MRTLTRHVLLAVFMLPCIDVQGADGDRPDSDTSHREFWNDQLQPFLEQYCYDCHAGAGAEADVDFEAYSAESNLKSQRPRWNQVRGMIEIGAMPPADYESQPTRDQREKIADWIDREINRVDCDVVNDPGRVTIRRLNNVEYDNTIRDLLSVDFEPSKLIGFASDDVGNGFDNQGDVLTLAPLQLEKYIQSAKYIADRAIVSDVELLRKQEAVGDKIFVGDTLERSFLFAAGQYEITARLEYGGGNSEDVPVALLIDGEEVQNWTANGRSLNRRHSFRAAPGSHTIGVKFLSDPHTNKQRDYRRRLEIRYLRIEGPKGGKPALPEPHKRIFVSYPDENKTVADAAREIFQPLIRRAFRREPTTQDVNRVVNLVTMATGEGVSFEKAVSYGLQSVLVSPHFLFRSEQPLELLDTGDNSGEKDVAVTTEALTQYALASRLSYFLWASMPDDQLLDLARDGRLSDQTVLFEQVDRMLKDDKASMLVQRFFGQAFGLGNLKEVDPSGELFPVWNDRLRDAMLEETYLFCQEILREDLPLDTLVTGDFTFVNPRLAELYGVKFDGEDPRNLYVDGPGFPVKRTSDRREGLYKGEDEWMKVRLPKGRHGILTQASVLTLTSNPTSTSPVKRGKWILENIFGDPPPPAPPNVPDFEATKSEHEDLTLREQLAIHRENPSCASCHNVMDPLGLGFENYDAIGQFRTKDGEHAIDAAGELADGRKFDGPSELVALMKQQMPDISRHFASKMLTYALGRGLEPYDYCAVDEVVKQAAQNDYRVSAFVKAIVTSEPFTRRRIQTEQ